MHRNTSKALIFATFFFAGWFLTGCEDTDNIRQKNSEQYNYSIFTFGTLIDISLYGVTQAQADTAFEQLQKNFDQYHQHWSPWTNGDLAQLNLQLSQPLKQSVKAIDVPEHLIPLIKESIVLSNQSHHFYNPTIGNLINLWQFHRYQEKDTRPPNADDIQNLIDKNPQMSDLSFNKNNQLINTNPAIALNFGAFAKGYAIKKEMQQLKKLNINHAVINAGGDLSVIGQHGDRAWNIGIKHPREERILASIKVKNNESIFTSGDYERFYHFQNQRYHHILDPQTGYPTHDLQSVTVLHQDAGRADAAATALFVAGSKQWLQIAKDMGIHHVMLIDAKGNIHLTPAMEERIKFLNKSSTSHIIVNQEL